MATIDARKKPGVRKHHEESQDKCLFVLSMLFPPDTPEYRKAQRQHLKATKNRPAAIDQEWTPFRASEKKFKARFPPPDLSNTLDLSSDKDLGHWVGSSTAFDYVNVALNDSKAVALSRVPGLVLLPGFLSHRKQKDLIRWSLSQHARLPNETNLDTHYVLPEDGLWNAYIAACNNPQRDFLVQPRASTASSLDKTLPGPRQLINNTPASLESFETISVTPKPPAAPSPSVQPAAVSSLIYKLRWANIGWYYHWGTKQYDFSKGPGVIDAELRSVCKDAVRSVDWGKVHRSQDPGWGPDGPDWETWDDSYEPDAGIVNFYQEKDTLMAHVDRSEVCATSPLVSISLGNSAVFLIGGLTRDVDPVPILLRSGDVVIMSGPACRRAYHGVPRILDGSLPPHLKSEIIYDDWAPYDQFMRTTRININVRQVFPKGFDPKSLLSNSQKY